MKALKFTLKGKDAFFKMPEVNSYYYFTYGNIHKPALLGLFGAILGYGGYEQMERRKQKTGYPEYYERLKRVQVSIVPRKGSKGYFQKKLQSFNNSVGYASQEQGGNLIVKQQWLELPEWDIYVKIAGEEEEKLADAIFQRRAVYIPYLGSNDHPAVLENPSFLELEEEKEPEYIDSLFLERNGEFDEPEEMLPYKYTEHLPIGLKEESHMYLCEKMVLTNLPILTYRGTVYKAGERRLVFV